MKNKIKDIASDAPARWGDIAEKVDENFSEVDNKKQDKLISGENIKTINGQSIIGKGDIEIKGGGGLDEDALDQYVEKNITPQINLKQNTLISGANIKTINGQSLLGFGNIEIREGATEDSYKMSVNLISQMYNAVSFNSKGNYINYTFDVLNSSGMPTGEPVLATYKIVRGSSNTEYKEVYRYGTKVSFNVDKYLGEGTNVVTINLAGQTSRVTTTFAVTYDVINLTIKDHLDISKVYNLTNNGTAYLEVPYDVTGSYTKIVEWYVDGVQLETNRTEDEILETTPTSRTKTITLANIQQGRHNLQFRVGSKINGEMFYSDTLYRDFFVFTGANYDFMMGVATSIPSSYGILPSGLVINDMVQYVGYNFKVASYSPTAAAKTDITITLDNEVVATIASKNDLITDVTIVPSTDGSKTLKLSADTIEYIIPTEVSATDMKISEITDALQLNFNARGKNNSATDRDTWTDGTHVATLTGFQWNSQSGWVNDRLEINENAELHINYAPLASHDNGKTIEIEWKSKNVSNENAILCDLRDSEGTGVLITASSLVVTSANKEELVSRYKSDEDVRMSIVINPDRGVNKGLTFIYINGVVSGAKNVVVGDKYESDAEIIFKGTSEASMSLKSIRIYDSALTTEQILNNYTLYRDDVADMLEVYNRNDIYDSSNAYDIAKMSGRLPVMLVTGDIPTLENTNDKDTQIIVDIEYTNMQDTSRSFVMRGAAMRPQGTSSMGYPKKNFRIYTRKVDSTILEVNGVEVADKLYSFKDKAIPVDCWCLKADYAESSGTHNTAIARMWGDAFKNAQVSVDLGENNPHNIDNKYALRTQAQQKAIDSAYPYDVRTTIDGFPILMFYRRTTDSDIIFIGKYNFNNDKSTEKVFGFTEIPGFNNSNMQCWELLNNGNPIGLFTDISDFYNDVVVDGKTMKGWQAAFESRYPDTKTPDTNDLYAFASWVNECKDDPQKFHNTKWEHLDVFKVAGYYCYLMRHGAADQFVKNAMLTSEDGEHFYFILYDNDTINGLNNTGAIAIEPTDDRDSVYADGSHKFAGYDSVLWNSLEQDAEFMEVVRAVDNALYTAGISYNNAIKTFDEDQASKWVERIYNLDAEYKYISPYTNSGTNNLFMLQGNRSIHRKWWLANRYSLYDSMFVSGAYKSGYVEIKCIDETMPTQNFEVTSGYPIYYGYGINGKLRERTDNTLAPNTKHTFAITEKVNLGDPIAIYGAPHIKALDLSSMMDRIAVLQLAGVYDEALGTKLEDLKIGSTTKENNRLTEISGIKNAKSLVSLDVTNIKGLTALDLSANTYLKSLKANGTSIASVVLATGAPIEYLSLPSTMRTVKFDSLRSLHKNGLQFENIANVRSFELADCPNLSDDFTWVYQWYSTKTIDNRNAKLHMDNIDWDNVDPDQLAEMVNIGDLKLKGKVKLSRGDQDVINQMRLLFGENVFDKSSEFYIKAPDGVFITGATKLLEGESERYVAAVFSEEDGIVQFTLATSRTGCSIDKNTGVLTTTENGLATSDIVVRVNFISSSNIISADITVTIEQRTYPTAVTIEGTGMVSNEEVYTAIITPTNVTGAYSIEWSISSEEYASITPNGAECTVKRIKDEIADVTLTCKIIKNLNNSTLTTATKTITTALPGVVVTSSSNSVLQSILYSNGLVANENYSYDWELALITDSQINPSASYNGSIFYSKRNSFTSFNEFQYFTGLLSIPNYAFYQCAITSITLPKNIKKIGDSALYGTKISGALKIPEGVEEIGDDALRKCSQLQSIDLPKSIKKIGGYAINGCTKLQKIICRANEVPSIKNPFYTFGYESSTSVGYETRNDGVNTLLIPNESFDYTHWTRHLTDANHGFHVEYLPPVEEDDPTLAMGSWIAIDQSITDPATMISGDVNGEHIQMIRNGSHRYLGKNTDDGVMTLCQLNDNDSTKYFDGTTALLTGEEGDVFMKMPKFFYRAVGYRGITKIGFYCGEESPSDDWLEWDTNALIGVYEIYCTDSKAYSRSGVTSSNGSTFEVYKSNAQNRGTGFQLVDWQMHCMMALLFYAQYGDTDCQTKIGYGPQGFGKITGYSNAKGMNDGTGDQRVTNFWGLENWWSCSYEFMDNILMYEDDEWEINEPNGTKRTFKNMPNGEGYISNMYIGYSCDLIPTYLGGSATTGYCDYFRCGSSYINTSGYNNVIRSGYYNDQNNGITFLEIRKDSYYNNQICSRLAFRGECIITTNTELFKHVL